VCGLLAYLSDPCADISPAVVDAVAGASHLMRHRGPDEPGTWSDEDTVLGFNRLSIIDIAHSHQPLRWGPPEAPDRYMLVFNGEIYNYLELRAELAAGHGAVFTTDGDGEAIIAAYHHWGTEALARLRGMFAFALWDTVEHELFCARDPFGIKPLFMASGPGGTAVGSEKKCLLELAETIGIDGSLDPRAVQHYTVLQYVPEPETLHRGVRRLESGSYARVRPGKPPEVTRYFTPRFDAKPFASSSGADAQRRYDEITAVLEDSVAKHMRADVTVGAFLSGGIDSTAIAALAMRHNPRLITFTTGFEREGFSEVDVAVASAEAIGARHVTKVVGQAEFVAALPEIVWYLDEPVADPALVPLFFIAREARKHVKVVLSGEGADELFGGYRRYRALSELRRLRGLLPPSEWAGWTQLKRRSGRFATLGKIGQAAAQASAAEALWQWQSVFGPDELRRLLPGGGAQAHPGARAYRTADGFRDDVPLDELANVLMEIEIHNRLVSFILERADKMSMANSLELRTPFLDYRLLEFSRRVPSRWKLDATGEKRILRDAFRDLLPEPVRRRGKRAFQSPYTSWLPSLSEALLPESRLVRDGWLASDPVRGLAAAFSRSERRAKQLWTVLMLEMWYRVFLAREELPPLGPRSVRAGARETPAPAPR
jgi:asparagine synthase (glutamine-hydrolysing)